MNATFLLHIGGPRWSVAIRRDETVVVLPVSHEPQDDVSIRAEAVYAILQEHEYAQEPIVLTLESRDCLSARISTEDLDRPGRRRAMAFRLEEQLPISSEEFVADYVSPGRDHALGVCTPLAELAAVLDEMQRLEVHVRHVVPFAWLASMHAAGNASVDGVLLAYPGDVDSAVQYDLVELRDGMPSRWLWLGEDQEALQDELRIWCKGALPPKRLAVLGEADCLPLSASLAEGVEYSPTESSPFSAALQSAEAILGEASTPWIDLRRDSLAPPDRLDVYRKPLGALVAALILLLVCVSGVMQWRGRRYEALSERARRQQAEVYQTTMNTRRVPAGVLHRLRSERRHLAGVGGKSLDGTDVQAALPTSALVHLQRILTGLPSDLRFRILDLSIQPDLIRIDGQARSHVEAEALVISLREQGAYEVEPPKTQALKDRDGKGVSVLFTAKPISGGER